MKTQHFVLKATKRPTDSSVGTVETKAQFADFETVPGNIFAANPSAKL